MKTVTVCGRVSEIYRQADWSSYGPVPKERPAGARAVRLTVACEPNPSAPLLMLDAVIAPELAKDLDIGSWVKVVLQPSSAAEAQKLADGR